MLFKQANAGRKTGDQQTPRRSAPRGRADRERDVLRALSFLDIDAARARVDAAEDRLCAALRLGDGPEDVASVLADPRVAARIEALAEAGMSVRPWNTDASSQMHGICVERALEQTAA